MNQPLVIAMSVMSQTRHVAHQKVSIIPGKLLQDASFRISFRQFFRDAELIPYLSRFAFCR